MRVKKVAFYILMLMPLVITLAALPFLPEQIPAHYGYDNQVNRWGSKYETLILPAVTALMGVFMRATAKRAAKQGVEGKNNENIVIISGIALLIMFNAMHGYFLYTSFSRVEDLSSVPVDLYQFLFVVLGAILIVMGLLMPKLRMNSVIGLRTTWSLKNEVTWEKSQRFGGVSFVIAGAVIILISLFNGGWRCFALSTGVMLVTVIIDIIYTYIIYRKHG